MEQHISDFKAIVPEKFFMFGITQGLFLDEALTSPVDQREDELLERKNF